jgi:hypothetical protein
MCTVHTHNRRIYIYIYTVYKLYLIPPLATSQPADPGFVIAWHLQLQKGSGKIGNRRRRLLPGFYTFSSFFSALLFCLDVYDEVVRSYIRSLITKNRIKAGPLPCFCLISTNTSKYTTDSWTLKFVLGSFLKLMYSPIDVRLLLHTVQRGQSVEKRTHVALSLLSGGGILGNGPNPSCCSFCFYYVLLSHVIRHSSTREKKRNVFLRLC